MLDASACEDCDDYVDEYIPTDRGCKPEKRCRHDYALEECEIVKEYCWDRFVDREDNR